MEFTLYSDKALSVLLPDKPRSNRWLEDPPDLLWLVVRRRDCIRDRPAGCCSLEVAQVGIIRRTCSSISI